MRLCTCFLIQITINCCDSNDTAHCHLLLFLFKCFMLHARECINWIQSQKFCIFNVTFRFWISIFYFIIIIVLFLFGFLWAPASGSVPLNKIWWVEKPKYGKIYHLVADAIRMPKNNHMQYDDHVEFIENSAYFYCWNCVWVSQ